MSKVDGIISKSKALVRKGRIKEARNELEAFLSIYPKNKRVRLELNKLESEKNDLGLPNRDQKLEAFYLRQYQSRKYKEILEHWHGKADQLNQSTTVLNIIGASFIASKEYQSAIKIYEIILRSDPNSIDAINNIGIAHENSGNLSKANEFYDVGLQKKPNSSDLMNNKANVLVKMGFFDEAEKLFVTLLKILPNNATILLSLGNLYIKIQAYKKAEKCLRKSIEVEPNRPESYNSLGVLLNELSLSDTALIEFKKAVQINPCYSLGFYNLGNTFRSIGENQRAIEAFREAVRLDQNNAQAFYNLGQAFQDIGNFPEGIKAFEKFVEIKPNDDQALAQLFYLRSVICDWKKFDDTLIIAKRLGQENFVTPLRLLHLEDAPDRHRQRSEVYCKKRFKPRASLVEQRKTPDASKKIHVGYFSSDFHEHPVMRLLIGVLELHSKCEFEITAFTYGKESNDRIRQRVKNCVDNYVDLNNLDDEAAARLVNEQEVDIAVDLNGYTLNNRFGIFSFRPAPVQISFLGYPGTTGADYMDYIVADQVLIPPSSQKYYSEKPIYLPCSYQPRDDNVLCIPYEGSRIESGLPIDAFVFCAINNSYKISPIIFGLWMRLLLKVPNGVLWVYEANEWMKENLLEAARKSGVSQSKIIFAQKKAYEENIARLRLADLFLDTPIYNAGATASDVLWAGVPVLTLEGKSYSARMATSLLTALGIPELIVNSYEDYEAVAFELASNLEKCCALRRKLMSARASSALFKPQKYVNALEKAYKIAYDSSINNKDCKTIYVTD